MIQMYLIVAAVSGVLSFGTAWTLQVWRYDAKISGMEKAAAVAVQQAEAKARKAEATYRDRVEEIAKNAAARQSDLEARTARVQRAARSLRDDITRLNARPAPSGAEAARYANDAARARELLGTCAEEYRGVAGAADRLRDQVTGLQSYARAVSEPAK